MIRRSFEIVGCCLLLAAYSMAQPPSNPAAGPEEPRQTQSVPPAGERGGGDQGEAATQESPGPPKAGKEAPSEAEQIARLQRGIEADRKKLTELQAKLEDPQSEYTKADGGFREIDAQLEAQKKKVNELQESGQAATAEAAELEDLQTRWKLAKDRFDLAIRERKTLQEQIATLETKIRQDQAALDKLTGAAKPEPPTTQPAAEPAAGPQPAAEQAPPAGSQGKPAAAPPGTEPAKPVVTTAPAQEKPKTEALIKAEAKAEEKETAAREAEEEAKSLSERIEVLRGLIDAERKQLQTSRAKADNALETERIQREELQKKEAEGAPRNELAGLRSRIAETQARFREARNEIRRNTDELDDLQAKLASLQSQHIEALQEAEQRRTEAEKAKQAVEHLQNPFAPENLLQWAIEHGPKVGLILLGMLVLLWVSRSLESRMVKLLTLRPGRGSHEERESRAKTLVGAYHHTAMVVIVVGGILMILREVGVDIAVLLGGAAVVGLAVAFGAQNLIRDYFTGFLILLENQYSINDVVKIGGVGGLVERITLRMTVLRDLEGVVHFIPNGQITTVSNMTHGWSRALFDIGVAYKEDVDQVMNVLVGLGREMRRDPQFANLILDDPEMLGVDSFGDSAIVIRFFIKTRPLRQWTVKREMLRRIKNKFDELGIEIPFPHRTVFYHQVTDGEGAARTASGPAWPPEAGPRR